MRTQIIVRSPSPLFPECRILAYGLDLLPTPGYFLSLYTGDPDPDTFLTDWDTRPHMAFSGNKPVSRHRIADIMESFPDIPREDIRLIRLDLPVGKDS